MAFSGILNIMFSFVTMNITSLKHRFNDVDRSSAKVELAIFTDGVLITLRTVSVGVRSSVSLDAYADKLDHQRWYVLRYFSMVSYSTQRKRSASRSSGRIRNWLYIALMSAITACGNLRNMSRMSNNLLVRVGPCKHKL